LGTTRSSSDRVKASIQPDASAGAINGKVTVRKVFNGGQPRFMAASSRLVSKISSRDCTTTVTKHVINVVGANVMGQKPRSIFTAPKKSSRANPGMASGTTSRAKDQ